MRYALTSVSLEDEAAVSVCVWVFLPCRWLCVRNVSTSLRATRNLAWKVRSFDLIYVQTQLRWEWLSFPSCCSHLLIYAIHLCHFLLFCLSRSFYLFVCCYRMFWLISTCDEKVCEYVKTPLVISSSGISVIHQPVHQCLRRESGCSDAQAYYYNRILSGFCSKNYTHQTHRSPCWTTQLIDRTSLENRIHVPHASKINCQLSQT